jgi:hypothetical protein
VITADSVAMMDKRIHHAEWSRRLLPAPVLTVYFTEFGSRLLLVCTIQKKDIPCNEEQADTQKPLLSSEDFQVTALTIPATPWCKSEYH